MYSERQEGGLRAGCRRRLSDPASGDCFVDDDDAQWSASAPIVRYSEEVGPFLPPVLADPDIDRAQVWSE